MIDYTILNGQTVKKLILAGELPEYKYLLDENGTQIPHDSPYHLETIFEHVCMVVDEASKLVRRLDGLSEEEKQTVMLASLWHDVGKIFARKPKVRLICDVCGRPHSQKHKGKCRTEGCRGETFTTKTVMGYENHEFIGTFRWILGNIFERENIPDYMQKEIKDLIRNHLKVMTAVKSGKDYPFTKLNLILSWADDKGRIYPAFDNESSGLFNQKYREVLANGENP